MVHEQRQGREYPGRRRRTNEGITINGPTKATLSSLEGERLYARLKWGHTRWMNLMWMGYYLVRAFAPRITPDARRWARRHPVLAALARCYWLSLAVLNLRTATVYPPELRFRVGRTPEAHD